MQEIDLTHGGSSSHMTVEYTLHVCCFENVLEMKIGPLTNHGAHYLIRLAHQGPL